MAKALSSWRELWQAKRYAMDLLRKSANHFRTPEVARAFEFWLDLVDQAHQQAQWISQQQEKAGLVRSREELEQELKRMQTELAQKLKAAEEEKLIALERLRNELSDSAAASRTKLAEQTKEQRVEQLHKRWARRMMQQGLALAFSSWQEYWEARSYAYDLLRHAGNHFKSPELAIGFDAWLQFAQQARQQALWVSQQQREHGLLKEHGVSAIARPHLLLARDAKRVSAPWSPFLINLCKLLIRLSTDGHPAAISTGTQHEDPAYGSEIRAAAQGCGGGKAHRPRAAAH